MEISRLDTYGEETKSQKFTKLLRGVLGGRVITTSISGDFKERKICSIANRILLGIALFTIGLLPYTIPAAIVLLLAAKPKLVPSISPIVVEPKKTLEVKKDPKKTENDPAPGPKLPDIVEAPILSKEEVRLFLGKPASMPISERTILTTSRLIHVIARNLPNMKIAKTVDNGDCFFDAFVQGYNAIRPAGQPKLTVKEARNIVSEFKGDAKFPEAVLRYLNGDSYVQWVVDIEDDFEAAKAKGKTPIWGRVNIEGRILANHFNCNLRVISEGLLKESQADINQEQDGFSTLGDACNRVCGDITNQWGTDKEIVIANIPDHFFAVLPK